MARRPDTPCAGGCGTLLWRGKGSRPNPVCHPCRRAGKGPQKSERVSRWAPEGTPATCETCRASFVTGKNTEGRFCSRRCANAAKGEARRKYASRTEQYRAKTLRRRAVLAGVPSEPYTLEEIAERDGYHCRICGYKVNMDLSGMDTWGPTVDHIIPLSRGGSNLKENVQLAHWKCNNAKSNKLPEAVA